VTGRSFGYDTARITLLVRSRHGSRQLEVASVGMNQTSLPYLPTILQSATASILYRARYSMYSYEDDGADASGAQLFKQAQGSEECAEGSWLVSTSSVFLLDTHPTNSRSCSLLFHETPTPRQTSMEIRVSRVQGKMMHKRENDKLRVEYEFVVGATEVSNLESRLPPRASMSYPL
jgi:hypothetical protein